MTRRALLLLASLTLGGVAILASCDDENPTGPGTPPTPSTLSAAAGATNSIAASWTMCVDTDFTEYRLYRSTEPGIAQDPPASPLFVTADPMDTTFTDTGLEWGETYYYAVRTFDSENLSSWSNEVAAVVPDSGAAGDVLTCYQVQGQEAQSPYLDQVVTVTGIVTVGGDEYYNSSGPVAVLGDPEGGPWTGLVLFGDEVGALARGDSVLITGTVDEYYDLTEMSLITNVEIVSSGHDLPPATDVETGDISGSKASAEEYEGVLCTVSDAVVTEVQGYGQFLADDGSGDCMVDDMGDYSYSPAEGDTLFSATGVLWYSYSEFKLEPRDDGDLDVSGGGGGGDAYTCYEIQGQQAASPFDGQSVSVTGIVVVAGGEWYSSSSAYAVIMDADGGPWSGLTLYGSEVADLARGDSVTVTGTIDEYYELTEMTYPYTGVVVHGTGHALPDPEPLDTGDVGDEQWESVLVSVSDATVTDEPDGYGQWMVDDGSGDLMVDDLGDYTYEPTLGDTLAEIVGICWYSFDDFKLEPRDDDDLTE